jgi:hypothetical protein
MLHRVEYSQAFPLGVIYGLMSLTNIKVTKAIYLALKNL